MYLDSGYRRTPPRGPIKEGSARRRRAKKTNPAPENNKQPGHKPGFLWEGIKDMDLAMRDQRDRASSSPIASCHLACCILPVWNSASVWFRFAIFLIGSRS